MQQILTTVSSENDWLSVVEYMKTFPERRRHEAYTANASRGQEIYRSCAPCHGTNGEGNESLQAPNIAILPAWYIIGQLELFRRGIRGAAVSDAPGNRMRGIAMTLKSDSDVAAVSAVVVEHMRW
jgi:cytochrome c oxidase subunit 2